jgi:hypothetical protein
MNLDILDINKLNSSERESVKKFTTEFTAINNGINENIVATMNRLSSNISEETNNTLLYKSLEEQINSVVLASTLKNLVSIKTGISDKFKEYNDLATSNNKLISTLAASIKENKQIIDGIYKTVAIINENIKTINDTLDKIQ